MGREVESNATGEDNREGGNINKQINNQSRVWGMWRLK